MLTMASKETDPAERERIRQQFGTFVTDQVAEAVLSSRIEGNRRIVDNATILHVAFYNEHEIFTSLPDIKDPSVVESLYDPLLVEDFDDASGTIDNLIQGELQINFGAGPLDFASDHAQRAVTHALKMRDSLKTVNNQRVAANETPFQANIVVNTGKVALGNFGAHGKKLTYTAMGIPVAQNREVARNLPKDQCNVYIGEETYTQVKDVFETIEDVPLMVEGDNSPRKVYKVVGSKVVLLMYKVYGRS